MNIEWTNAALLGLLALTLVPLLLHLFARTRPPVYEFSSVEFLRRIVRKTMRLKKPQDWILLVLRTLVFFALIAVFLRPLLFSNQKLAGLLDQKNVVLLVDASASMSAREGAQSRFAAACAEASEVLGGLTANDQANLIWIDSEPDAVFPELGSNFGFLKDSLRRARVSSEHGSIEKAVQLALQMLGNTDGRREICVVSDFQRSAWESAEVSVPPNVDLVFLRVGQGDVPNLALAELLWDPQEPVVGEEVTVFGEVENFSPREQISTVFCALGENRQSRNVTVPAWGRANVAFRHRISEAGAIPVTLSLAEDAFSGDDRRFQVIPARHFLNVGVFTGTELDTAKIWRAAAQALEWVQVSDLTRERLADNLGEFDAIFLAGWNGEKVGTLGPETKLIALPSSGGKLAPLLDLLNAEKSEDDFTFSKRSLTNEANRSIRTLQLAAEDDPLFEMFAGGAHGDPTAGEFSQRFEILPNAIDPSSLLLVFGDGTPGLARLGQQNYLWNLPLEPKATHWAGRVEFLPFFAELLLQNRGSGKDFHAYEPGNPLAFNSESDVNLDDLTVAHENHEPLALERRGTRQFVSAPAQAPGLYEWKLAEDSLHFSPVNFPLTESNLQTMDPRIIGTSGTMTAAGGSDVRFMRDGLQLWPLLLTAGILCLFAEAGVLVWTTKTA